MAPHLGASLANITKTTSRGMPFALVKSGFLDVNSPVSWSTKWLNLVRQALQRTTEVFPGFKPDFLLPQCNPNLEHSIFSAPLSRSPVSWSTKWLNLVRQALQNHGSFPWVQARFLAASMWSQFGALHFLCTFAAILWSFTFEQLPQTVT